MSEAARRVVPVANLREFFRDTLHGALVRQHLAVEDQTEHYVVNLLTLFARSEALFESTEVLASEQKSLAADGPIRKPRPSEPIPTPSPAYSWPTCMPIGIVLRAHSSHFQICASVPQIPHAATLKRTSPSPISGIGTDSTTTCPLPSLHSARNFS